MSPAVSFQTTSTSTSSRFAEAPRWPLVPSLPAWPRRTQVAPRCLRSMPGWHRRRGRLVAVLFAFDGAAHGADDDENMLVGPAALCIVDECGDCASAICGVAEWECWKERVEEA